MTFLPFLYYLEKMIDEIRKEPKPDGKLNPEQIYTLCLYKRERRRIKDLAIEKDSNFE